MTDHERRKPAAFRLDDPAVTVTASAEDKASSGNVRVLTEDDAFAVPVPVEPAVAPARKGFRTRKSMRPSRSRRRLATSGRHDRRAFWRCHPTSFRDSPTPTIAKPI